MDWVEELADVGIEDIHRLEMVIPPEDVDTAIGHMLPQLQANVTIHGPTMTDEAQSDLAPVMTLFGTPSLVQKHRADLQIYMEACKAYSLIGSARFLVTDDHKFYKLFLHSSIAEESLHTVCIRALGIEQGVRVKLAGEIIPGV